MRIDAHQHYWRLDRGDYGWLTPALPVLYRDFLPEDLQAHLQKHRLDGTIAVQAAPTYEETEYLLSLSERDASILGVVGYLDPSQPDHLAHYERFAGHPRYVGFRIMIQDMPDAAAILEPAYIRAMAVYAEKGVPVDLLVVSHQLDELLALMIHIPTLRGVVDHIAKPRIAEGVMDPWRDQLRQLAAYPNLYCKLSGIVTEANHADWSPEQLAPYIRHALDCFGPERVMFGSDWPVSLLASDYDRLVEALELALPEAWGEAERARLFGLNAKEFYRL